MDDSPGNLERPKVAVVYHFFAHYRAAVLEELLQSPVHHYLLVADRSDPDGLVKEWCIKDETSFIYAPCKRVRKGLLLQKGLVRLAFRRDVSGIIFLGNAAWPMTWVSAAAARMTGKRVLFWTHGWTRRDKGIRKFLRNTFYSLGHGLLLYGHRAKGIGEELGFSPANLYVIYNSLDYHKQASLRRRMDRNKLIEIRQELFSDPNVPVAIFTGRLIREKKAHQLLEAVGMLVSEGHVVNVLIVGDGPESDALVAQSARLKTEVHFEGACYDEERLAGLLMTSNISVAPDYVGLSAIHCLSYGTPMLANHDAEANGPEWEAIQPGISGDFFERDSIPALAAALRRWTAEPFPSEEIRGRCYEVIEKRYHPRIQRELIDRAIVGEPAID